MAGLTFLHAGADISAHVNELSINIDDALGQGNGTPSQSSARAATCDFVTDLGPMASAIGAGSPLPAINRLSPNQSDVETDASGFGSVLGAALSRNLTEHWHGMASLMVVTPGSVTNEGMQAGLPSSSYIAGETVTISVYLKGSGSVVLKFVEFNVAQYGFANLTLTNVWTRYTVTATLPGSLVVGHTYGIQVTTRTSAQAITFYADGLQIEGAASASAWVLGGSPAPALVRHGEVQVIDATGAYVFGGFATQLDDATTAKSIKTKITCVDYWAYLVTIIVNETYDGESDIFIIRDLLTKYASWVDLSLLPTSASYTFGPEVMQHWTLQDALQRIVDKTGYLLWIDAQRRAHYVTPLQASTAPYAVHDTPNFSSTFQYKVDTWTIDDLSAINRVFFYGGKHLSNDITQDLSIQCNGVNDLFTLAYYPHKASDGVFHIKKNGVEQVIGIVGSATDKLIHDGGSCDVLLNIDAHTIQWNTAPAAGAVVQAIYRREVPLVVVIEDKASVAFYGKHLDGTISDETIFDTNIAVKRCQTLLLEQSFGLETLEIKTWRAGLQSGQILRVDNTVRNIHKSYLIQEVKAAPKGAGFFEYTVTLGAWNWGVVDIMLSLARRATPDDDSSSSETIPISVEPATESAAVHDAWTTTSRQFGVYYARSSAVGDGHDAYCGFCTISS